MDNPHLKTLTSIGFEAASAAIDYNKWEMKYLLKSIEAVRNNIDQIYAVKECLANDDIEGAKANVADISVEDQELIWRAPSKGGIFETRELAALKGVKC
jgi:hypothetical protein